MNPRAPIEPAKARYELRGASVFPGLIGRPGQEALVEDIRAIARAAPFTTPVTPAGRKMSVRITAAGQCGWTTGRGGYAYARVQPDGQPWPPIPASVLEIWRAVSGCARDPDSLLVNFYGEGARMGLHQDRDEGDFGFPVVSVSLGDEALFRIGGTARSDPTGSVWLKSGDVLVLGGAARLAYHGVDRIRFGSSSLLPGGGRINLTLRVAGCAHGDG